MLADGLLTQIQDPADLPVGLALDRQEETVALARRQPRRAWRRKRPVLTQPPRRQEGETADQLRQQQIFSRQAQTLARSEGAGSAALARDIGRHRVAVAQTVLGGGLENGALPAGDRIRFDTSAQANPILEVRQA